MAKWINEEQHIIDKHITNYVSRITDFSKYLEGTPTFVTYYSKDVAASTADITLQGVHELIGNNSPIKYNKIKHYPIYNIEELTPNLDYDEENGSSTNIEGSAIVIPNAGMKPLEDDFFIIEHDTRNILFQIHQVEMGTIADKTAYKINFFYTSYDSKVLEERQISKTFETLYDNVGPNSAESKIVLEEDYVRIIRKLQDKKEELKKRYITFFYNKDLDCFVIHNEEDGVIYDNLLMRFINNNKLFIDKKTYNKNIYVEPKLKWDSLEDIAYEASIYHSVEMRSCEKFSTGLMLTNIKEKFCIFDVNKHKYGQAREIDHIPSEFNADLSILDNKEFLLIKGLHTKNNPKIVCPLCHNTFTHRHILSTEGMRRMRDALYSFNEDGYEVIDEQYIISICKSDNMKTPVFVYELYTPYLTGDTSDNTECPLLTQEGIHILANYNDDELITDIDRDLFIDFFKEELNQDIDAIENIDVLNELKDKIMNINFKFMTIENYIWIPIIIKIIDDIIFLYQMYN